MGIVVTNPPRRGFREWTKNVPFILTDLFWFSVPEEIGQGEDRERDDFEPKHDGAHRRDLAGGHTNGPDGRLHNPATSVVVFVVGVRPAHEHVVGRQQQQLLVEQTAVRGRHAGVLRLRQFRSQGVAGPGQDHDHGRHHGPAATVHAVRADEHCL